MKPYEKPRLMALSLGGNDQLCGSCSGGTTIYNDPALQGLLVPLVDFNNDGKITKDEVERCFGDNDDCAAQGKIPAGNYCKFTSTTNLIAWS